MEDRRFPLVLVIATLALSLLYFGSYMAVVEPGGIYVEAADGYHTEYYRFANPLARIIFWPIEKVDRRARPKDWHDPW
jgi:hypothetical protein